MNSTDGHNAVRCRSFDVVGLGYTATDYLAIVPRLPELDTKLEARCLSIQGGGPAATALVTAARLGLTAAYIGKVGDDDFGRFMLEELGKEKVDVSAVVCEEGSTSQFAFVMVDENTGHRTIVWTRGSVSKLRRGEADLSAVEASRCLILDDLEVEAAVEAVERARRAGVPAVLDAGSLRAGMDKLIPLCDFVVGTREFAFRFTGERDPAEAARKIFEGTGNVAVVTLGDEGSVCVGGDGVLLQPAFGVQTVDTTGAGDVFHGAFAVGVVKGWAIPRVLEFSSAVAAMKCTRLGGRPGIPDFEGAISFLRDRSPNAW
ncbi:MAG: PfkB family carbohydrate kinase [Candidatus Eisenbacteria bacterium]